MAHSLDTIFIYDKGRGKEILEQILKPRFFTEFGNRGLFSTAQWSEGVTKPTKQYSKIDTAWDFLIVFGCIMIE